MLAPRIHVPELVIRILKYQWLRHIEKLDPKFWELLASGAYAYATIAFISATAGKPAGQKVVRVNLTEYAKAYSAKCYIEFDVQRRVRWANDGMFATDARPLSLLRSRRMFDTW